MNKPIKAQSLSEDYNENPDNYYRDPCPASRPGTKDWTRNSKGYIVIIIILLVVASEWLLY